MFSNKLKGLYCIICEENFLHDSFDQTIKVCLENKITDASINKRDSQLEDELVGIKNYYADGTKDELSGQFGDCF